MSVNIYCNIFPKLFRHGILCLLGIRAISVFPCMKAECLQACVDNILQNSHIFVWKSQRVTESRNLGPFFIFSCVFYTHGPSYAILKSLNSAFACGGTSLYHFCEENAT